MKNKGFTLIEMSLVMGIFLTLIGITFVGIFAGAFGGILATILGFKVVFVLVSMFGLLSSSTLLLIRKNIFLKDHFAPRVPPSEKPF